jgi:ABC-type Fe3+/spermidine/putrescine transport system ATPase subunit
MTMSDRIAVMNAGRLEQLDTPEVLYRRPATAFVAGFIGDNNLLACQVSEIRVDAATVQVLGLTMYADADKMQRGLAAGPATLAVRPESVRVAARLSGLDAVVEGAVEQHIFAGSEVRLLVRCPGGSVLANLRDEGQFHLYSRGDRVQVGWKRQDAMLLIRS